jgi:hypothetical protein
VPQNLELQKTQCLEYHEDHRTLVHGYSSSSVRPGDVWISWENKWKETQWTHSNTSYTFRRTE